MTLFRHIALQNLQRINLGFSETVLTHFNILLTPVNILVNMSRIGSGLSTTNMVTKFRYSTLYGPSEPGHAHVLCTSSDRQATPQLESTEATFTISAVCLYQSFSNLKHKNAKEH